MLSKICIAIPVFIYTRFLEFGQVISRRYASASSRHAGASCRSPQIKKRDSKGSASESLFSGSSKNRLLFDKTSLFELDLRAGSLQLLLRGFRVFL